MASLRVNRRALTLATRGLLAGSAIALATHGLIQLPAEPPVIEVPVTVAPAAAGGSSLHYFAGPRHWKRLSEGRFILDADSLAWLEQHQPLEIKLEPTKLRAIYNAEGVLHILTESQWRYWENDDDLIILLALQYFGSDRNA